MYAIAVRTMADMQTSEAFDHFISQETKEQEDIKIKEDEKVFKGDE